MSSAIQAPKVWRPRSARRVAGASTEPPIVDHGPTAADPAATAMDVAWAVILEGPLLTMSGRPAPEPAATPPAVTGLPEEDRVTLAMSAADTTVNQLTGDEFSME